MNIFELKNLLSLSGVNYEKSTFFSHQIIEYTLGKNSSKPNGLKKMFGQRAHRDLFLRISFVNNTKTFIQ